MWSFASKGSPVGSYFSTPCFASVDASCFSTISTPSCSDSSVAAVFVASASSPTSTVDTALPKLSATSSRSLQNPWMANFSAASACRRVRSRRFSMSASVRRSLSFRSFTCASRSPSSARSFSVSSSPSPPPSPSSASSSASSFFSPSALNAREDTAPERANASKDATRDLADRTAAGPAAEEASPRAAAAGTDATPW